MEEIEEEEDENKDKEEIDANQLLQALTGDIQKSFKKLKKFLTNMGHLHEIH